MHKCVHCGTIHNSKDMESTQMSIDDRQDKVNVVHIYMKYSAAIKINEVMSFAGIWMELKAVILSKLTQEQNTKYHMFTLISES